jgi:asparagine synthase (glutamine-hydrolysing)
VEVLNAIRHKLYEAVEKRMIADPDVPVGVSLSGGLDSSLVAAIAREGRDELNTFVVGISGSDDLVASQDIADTLGTRHHRYEYTFEEMLDALPEVIYHLESFDAALVRSAIPNYFLAKLASQHVKVILTGEGADELYAGYEYFRDYENPQALQDEMVTITGNLHNTNLQRADRMSMAYGLEARVPFLDREFVDFSLSLPPGWKLHGEGKVEKDLLRRACRDLVPPEILNRPKQKFSDGAGSMDLLGEHAGRSISDTEFIRHRDLAQGYRARSKEELYYYQIFHGIFGDSLDVRSVGRTRSITAEELN